MKKAFTMVELIFVIVVIAILATIAVPKLAATRDDAEIAKARATVAALRSAVAVERQKRILRGDFSNITDTEAAALLDTALDSDWSGLTYTGPSGNSCAFTVTANKLVKGTCSVAAMSDL